jgi:FecR-like protein
MSHLALIAMLQLVISTKAGLVNHVQGVANVSRMTQVPAGTPIRTALNGYAEVLLTPGVFLRLDENSEVVLDRVEIADCAVRVIHGVAVVEAIEINKDYPIEVTTGNLTAKVFQKGIYRFEDGKATVIEGKLRTAEGRLAYSKGWQVSYETAKKIGTVKPSSVDLYSQQRSELIARANATMLNTARSMGSWESDYWLFAPGFGFTFLPRASYTSPYGYRYYGVRTPSYNNGSGFNGSSGISAANGGGNSGNSGTGVSPAPSNGGGGGGSIAVAPPAPPPTPQPAGPAAATGRSTGLMPAGID